MVDTSTHEPALEVMCVVAQRDAPTSFPIIQQFINIGTGVTSGVHTIEVHNLMSSCGLNEKVVQ